MALAIGARHSIGVTVRTRLTAKLLTVAAYGTSGNVTAAAGAGTFGFSHGNVLLNKRFDKAQLTP